MRTVQKRGFSLIELLIVVAIILIIAAIAIPNMVRARISANEASAASSVRKIATAEITYNAAYPTVGYASDLASLGGPAGTCTPSSSTACIIDNVLTNGTKSGYQFVATGIGGTPNVDFVAGAAPVGFNQTGVRNFCVATDGVLRSLNPPALTPPPTTVTGCTTVYVAQ